MSSEEIVLQNLNRLVSMGEQVITRLDSSERLSLVLYQARRLAQETNDARATDWLTLEIEGSAQRKVSVEARIRWLDGRAIVNIDEVTVDSEPPRIPTRNMVLHQSIDEIERYAAETDQRLAEFKSFADKFPNSPVREDGTHMLQQSILNGERKRVLQVSRGLVYEYCTKAIQNLRNNIDGIALMGIDYRIVTDCISALDTALGDELKAAISRINSANPADWNSSALTCRNVVLKLGRLLWNVEAASYTSVMLERPLDLRGEKEMNRLTAFIDVHYAEALPDAQLPLRSLAEKALYIYEHGSSGKNMVRQSMARELVVRAFELVAGLNDLTGLTPITSLKAAPSPA